MMREFPNRQWIRAIRVMLLGLLLVGPASLASAARSITITGGQATHYLKNMLLQTKFEGSGAVARETGDQVMNLELKIDAFWHTTNYVVTFTGNSGTWSGYYETVHFGGPHDVRARICLRDSAGMNHLVETTGSISENCDQ